MEWIHFPRSTRPPQIVRDVIDAMHKIHPQIASARNDLLSNDVLALAAEGLEALGFKVERGKSGDDKVPVPVLYGLNGELEKAFFADAYHAQAGVVVEVEAGAGVANNSFLKDLFQACVMDGVTQLVIAVRIEYRKSRNFDTVRRYFETLYASGRLKLPLHGVTIIGY